MYEGVLLHQAGCELTGTECLHYHTGQVTDEHLPPSQAGHCSDESWLYQVDRINRRVFDVSYTTKLIDDRLPYNTEQN